MTKLTKPYPSHVPWYGETNFGGWYGHEEIDAAVKAMRNSTPWHIGFGHYHDKPDEVSAFEQAFAKYVGTKHAIAITSCGVGLDIAMMCLDLKEGDEIITPAINYKASATAALGQGAKVVFCDIDPVTFTADVNDVRRKITRRTRAIVPVHQVGLPADMDGLITVAESFMCRDDNYYFMEPIRVIGDAARATGMDYKDRKIGKDGWCTCFSFHSQKLMTTLGEGGMITTDDDELASRIYEINHFGGESERWGSNYRMTKVQAAVGLIQLNKLDYMNTKRRVVAHARNHMLRDIPEITLPQEPKGYRHIYYVYPLLVQPSWAGAKRDRLIEIMTNQYGIIPSVTNRPTYRRWKYIAKMCGIPNLPVTEDIGSRMICLPIHPLLNEEQELYICSAFRESINQLKGEL